MVIRSGIKFRLSQGEKLRGVLAWEGVAPGIICPQQFQSKVVCQPFSDQSLKQRPTVPRPSPPHTMMKLVHEGGRETLSQDAGKLQKGQIKIDEDSIGV